MAVSQTKTCFVFQLKSDDRSNRMLSHMSKAGRLFEVMLTSVEVELNVSVLLLSW